MQPSVKHAEVRVRLDELMALMRTIGASRELSLMLTKLQEARMWLDEDEKNQG